MNDFFSKNESYDIPSTSNYMRWEEGDNRFRILGSFADGTAIRGTEYWTTVDGTRKPKRLKMGVPVPVEELEMNAFGEPDRPKHFWAFPVWNYQEKRVQILEITQKTILDFIKKQVENPKWGDPRQYDIVVTRTKEGNKTNYTVSNDPKEPLDKSILKAYQDMSINTPALFTGDDPFSSSATEDVDVNELPENMATA